MHCIVPDKIGIGRSLALRSRRRRLAEPAEVGLLAPTTPSTGANRWAEKAGLQRDELSSQVIDALEAREIEETGDEEAYHYDDAADTQQAGRTPNHRPGSGDRSSFYCVLDEAGEVLLEQRVSTTPKAIKETFWSDCLGARIALETGTHSPWVGRLFSELGHEAIVAHARSVRLIEESRRKDDRARR